jgi:hypothetical protein
VDDEKGEEGGGVGEDAGSLGQEEDVDDEEGGEGGAVSELISSQD